MRTVRKLTAVLLGLSTAFAGTGPAEAAVDTRTTVQVQVAGNVSIAGYDIDQAIRHLNARTGRTKLVRTRCTAGPARCIRVTFAPMPKGNYYGLGMPPGTEAGYVKLAVKSRKLNWALRRRLFLHELGHTRNLAHNDSCATVMHSWMLCRGALVPYGFAAAERAALRQQ